MVTSLSLKTKTLFSFFIVVIVIACVGVFEIYRVREMITIFDNLASVTLKKQKLAFSVSEYANDAVNSLVLSAVANPASSFVQDGFSDFQTNSLKYEEILAEYQKYEVVEEEKKILTKLSSEWAGIKDLSKSIERYSQDPEKMKLEQDLIDDLDTHRINFKEYVKRLVSFHSTQGENSSKLVQEKAKTTLLAIMASIFISAVISLIVGYLFARKLHEDLTFISEEINLNARSTSETGKELLQSSEKLSSSSMESAASLQ